MAATVQPNYGRVATLGLTPGDLLSVQGGRVVNPDGQASTLAGAFTFTAPAGTPSARNCALDRAASSAASAGPSRADAVAAFWPVSAFFCTKRRLTE